MDTEKGLQLEKLTQKVKQTNLMVKIFSYLPDEDLFECNFVSKNFYNEVIPRAMDVVLSDESKFMATLNNKRPSSEEIVNQKYALHPRMTKFYMKETVQDHIMARSALNLFRTLKNPSANKDKWVVEHKPGVNTKSVSYTHLTLPTILRV